MKISHNTNEARGSGPRALFLYYGLFTHFFVKIQFFLCMCWRRMLCMTWLEIHLIYSGFNKLKTIKLWHNYWKGLQHLKFDWGKFSKKKAPGPLRTSLGPLNPKIAQHFLPWATLIPHFVTSSQPVENSYLHNFLLGSKFICAVLIYKK